MGNTPKFNCSAKLIMNRESGIHDYEVTNLVNKLIGFLGRNEVEKCLKRYKHSLKSSGPVFRDYYLKTRHPWWNAFIEYFGLEKAGKSIRKNLTENIKILAGDAKKISILQKFMPESVKNKYKKDLIDDNRAFDYLFEIQIAWHFYLKGGLIQWYEDDGHKHPEFLVKTPSFEFDVECKRISVDASRKIRRRDFYRFSEKLNPLVEERGYSGTIDINIQDRLHSSDKYLNDLTSQVLAIINQGQIKGHYEIPLGSLSLNLDTSKGVE